MPIYSYHCQACGHADGNEVMKIAEGTLVRDCPKCGKNTYMKQVVQIHTDLKGFHTPITMHSIGCTSVDQIREMQEAGVSIITDPKHPDYGTPIAHNRAEKKRALKVAGFQETN